MSTAAHNLQAQHPRLAFHLADTANEPILSSSSTPEHEPRPSSSSAVSTSTTISQTTTDATQTSSANINNSAAALSELTRTFLATLETASRLQLGGLKRLSLETETGIGLVQSYIEPEPSTTTTAEGEAADAKGARRNGAVDAKQIRIHGDWDDRQDQARKQTRDIDPRRADEVMKTDEDDLPPGMIATVVAPSREQMVEAGVTLLELEGVAEAIQEAWVEEAASGTDMDDGHGHDHGHGTGDGNNIGNGNGSGFTWS